MVVFVYKCKTAGNFIESDRKLDLATERCPEDNSELEFIGDVPE